MTWYCLRFPDTPEQEIYAVGSEQACRTWAEILRDRGEPAAVVAAP